MSSYALAGSLVLVLLVGLLSPLQVAVNISLAKALGHPFWGIFVSFMTGFLAIALVVAVTRPGLPHIMTALRQPAWIWLGGAMGVIMLVITIIVGPKIGAIGLIAVILAGQMVASFAIDQFGIGGFPVKQMTAMRMIGVLLVVAGALIVNFSPTPAPAKTATPTEDGNSATP